MLLGSVYVLVHAGSDQTQKYRMSIVSDQLHDAGIRWAAQALPGTDGQSDGEVLDFSAGSALLDLSRISPRAVVLTALPADEQAYDPEWRYTDPEATPDERFEVTLEFLPLGK
jgi:hypothetical protein